MVNGCDICCEMYEKFNFENLQDYRAQTRLFVKKPETASFVIC